MILPDRDAKIKKAAKVGSKQQKRMRKYAQIWTNRTGIRASRCGQLYECRNEKNETVKFGYASQHQCISESISVYPNSFTQ